MKTRSEKKYNINKNWNSMIDKLSERDMVYVGVDLHKEVVQIEVQRADSGEVLFNGCMDANRGLLTNRLGKVRERVISICAEATGSWYWFADMCDELSITLKLANPMRMKIISQSANKCDRVDAHWLCEFLRIGLLPESSVMQRERRDAREVLRVRDDLKGMSKVTKNRIRSLMNRYALKTFTKSPFALKGRKELRVAELNIGARIALDHLLDALESLEAQLLQMEKLISDWAYSDPQACGLMEMIPGMGPILAAYICLESAEPTDFPSNHHYAAHTGLVSSTKESAGIQLGGPITKQGPPKLRWALVQLATQIVRWEPTVKNWYQRHRRRKGAMRAKVMVAHKLARYIWMYYNWGVVFKPQELFPPARAKTETEAA